MINIHGCCSPVQAPRTIRHVKLESPVPRDFGASVRRRRKKLGLTIAALAERARVSVNWISEIERGRAPSFAVLIALAKALEIPAGELLGEAPRHSAEATEAARLVESLPVELQAPLLQFLRIAARKLARGQRGRS